MTLKTFISKIVARNPGYYRKTTYEESEINILNHIFFVCGNGLIREEDAIVDPSIITLDGSSYELPDDYFGREILQEIVNPITGVIRIIEARSLVPFVPYPITGYSMALDVLTDPLASDWMDGLKRLTLAAIQYYATKSQWYPIVTAAHQRNFMRNRGVAEELVVSKLVEKFYKLRDGQLPILEEILNRI